MAVLSFGSIGGCGDGGGGGDEPDADETDASDEDSGSGGRKDGGTDGGMDGGDEEDADVICVPKGCSDLGAECGEPDDGCGNSLDCGGDCFDESDPATEYFTCGGGGQEYKCGCTPKTCDDALICGTLPDGCGGELACGDECDGEYDTCGGGGARNACGCTPDVGACGTAQCGTAADGCGGTLQCGSHGGGCSEARTCNGSKQCECKPDAELCVGRCGQQTIDGCSVNCGGSCGECAPGQECSDCTCPGGGVCSNNACCTPEPQATTCGSDVCGSKTNNCGQTVNCGGCTVPAQCSAGQCVDARTAALTGTYAMYSVGFAVAIGQVTRVESIALVTISSTQAGLTMREQGCYSAAFLASGSSEENISQFMPQQAQNVFPTVTPLQLAPDIDSAYQSLPGTKDWLRGKASRDQNAVGWRRGRPDYCPARTSPTDEPAANVTGGPSPDPLAIGPNKPWLDEPCLCPEREVRKRGLCAEFSGAERAACIDDWTENSLPYQREGSGARPDADVTDCRVVDDEQDGEPGVTASVKSVLGSADVRTASLVANFMWGKVDLSGAKRHWGVLQDDPEIRASNVSCEPKTGLGGILCGTSEVETCPGYVDGERLSPVELVPLDTRPTPDGGWTCQAVYDSRLSLFGMDVWRADYWRPRYPAPSGVCGM